MLRRYELVRASEVQPNLTYRFERASKKQGQVGGGGGDTADAQDRWRKIYAATGRVRLDWRPRKKAPLTLVVLEGPLLYPYCAHHRSWGAQTLWVNDERHCSHCRRRFVFPQTNNMDNEEVIDACLAAYYALNMLDRTLLTHEVLAMVGLWHELVPTNSPY